MNKDDRINKDQIRKKNIYLSFYKFRASFERDSEYRKGLIMEYLVRHNCKICKTAFCGATIEALNFVWKRNVSIPLSYPLQLYPNFPVSSRSCSFTLGSIYSRWQCSGNHILKLVSRGVEAMVS